VAAVETAADRKPRRPRPGVVEGFREKGVEKLAKRDLAAGGAVASDGPSCRPAVEEAGCPHRPPTATGAGERAAGWTPFRWVDTALGDIETATAGAHRRVGAEHARSRLTSFACRLDRRRRLDGIVERLARAAVHIAPQPYRAVAADAQEGWSGRESPITPNGLSL
jgi:hypothetical protein